MGVVHFDVPANGSLPDLLRRPGQVMVTHDLAQDLNLGVGSLITTTGIGSSISAYVDGILASSGMFANSTAIYTALPPLASDRPASSTAPSTYHAKRSAADQVKDKATAAYPFADVETAQDALKSNRGCHLR